MARRYWLIGLSVFWFVCDQAIKKWVQSSMMSSQSIPVWPDVFQITFVHNTGAAFSMFEEHPGVLLGVTIALFLILFYFAFKKARLTTLELFGYSLILGGASGNIADRLLLGKVVDYLDFVLIRYPVFNLADACIFCGVCLLIIYQLKAPVPKSNAV